MNGNRRWAWTVAALCLPACIGGGPKQGAGPPGSGNPFADAGNAAASPGADVVVNAYPSGAPVPLEELNQRTMKVLCTLAVACGERFFSYRYATVSGCFDVWGSSPWFPSDVAKAGKIAYDPYQAGLCLQTLGKTCASLHSFAPRVAACKAMFKGKVTVQEGEICEVNEQCASDNCEPTLIGCPARCGKPVAWVGEACVQASDCWLSLPCIGGQCLPPQPGKLGEPCGKYDESCEAGATCGWHGESKGTCVVCGQVGAVCSDDLPCCGQTHCQRAIDADTGTCTELAKVGQACSFFGSSGEVPCEGLAMCRDQGHEAVCVAPAGLGDPCFGDEQCRFDDLLCQDGKCQPLPQKGQACGGPEHVDTDRLCRWPYACLQGHCTDRPKAGQPCEVGSGPVACEQYLPCRNGLCELRPAEGQPCEEVSCDDGLQCQPDSDGKHRCQKVVCPPP